MNKKQKEIEDKFLEEIGKIDPQIAREMVEIYKDFVQAVSISVDAKQYEW